MAKEMMIVFVYDTEACTTEEDDPADAVLYFHPGWVSDTQRHALAGQVVGTAHCVKALFSQPVAITLQSGKFILRDYGRYILAVGSDRNIPDWVLSNRASLLSGMIRVYHGDLARLGGRQGGRLADALYRVLETYLPVLQYGAHIFQRVPMLTLPKSATSVYMEAMNILDHCTKIRGVLGGIMLYNNKIVATQLPPALTSYLTVVDPYRIKSPAETIETEVPLPLGAQLLAVYVGTSTYDDLKKRADTMQEFAEDAEAMIAKFKKNLESEKEKIPQMGMKRDKSLLFTAVPEEDQNMISPPSQSDGQKPTNSVERTTMPDVVPFTNKPRPRPNKLTLNLKPQKSIEEVCQEEKVFTGQTSVCSTPMVEYKRLHDNVISICQNPDSQNTKTEPDVLKHVENGAKLNTNVEKRDGKVPLEFNYIDDRYISKPAPIRKLVSVSDIQESLRRLSNRATSKFKFKKDESPEDESIKAVSTMTINDPSFPVFRNDGVAISESLFNQYLQQHYAGIKDDDDNMFAFNSKLNDKKLEDFDMDFKSSPQRTPKKIVKEAPKTPTTDLSRRKSLSLPLKSLSESSDSQFSSDSEVLSFKKKLSGVQLTPLMEKLSHLAFSDKSSGYSSRVMTPLELREYTPSAEKQISFSDRAAPAVSRLAAEREVPLDALASYSAVARRGALFVAGLHNMALLVLLEEHAAHQHQLINALWEISLNALGPIEQKCMEPIPAENEAVDYSYLTLDADWGTIKKGGPWPSLDIATMGLIHSEFAKDPQLSEMVLRGKESCVLGAVCGGSHVYYAEGAGAAAGEGALGGNDPLSAAPLRARRRLQRDHAVTLL